MQLLRITFLGVALSACGGGVECLNCLDGAPTDADALDASDTGPPSSSEECNAMDDDEDGRVDEACLCDPNLDAACGSSVGACRPGRLRCRRDGSPAICEGSVEPQSETCNGIDDDCDSQTDEDVAVAPCGEERGECRLGQTMCIGGQLECVGSVSPSDDICNALDDDCDGTVDEAVAVEVFADRDGDGFGDADAGSSACAVSSGFVLDATDCNDGCEHCHPGQAETCDNHDNDCDGSVDEGVTTVFYLDYDGDGYGGNTAVQACSQPLGHVTRGMDCDDNDGRVNPGQRLFWDEARANGSWDYNCDNLTDYEVMRFGNNCDCFSDPMRWTEQHRPQCGESGLVHHCDSSSPMCTYLGIFTRTQRCR